MLKDINTPENKEKLKVGLVALTIFLVGFGTGKAYNKQSSETQSKLNYTTKKTNTKAKNITEIGEGERSNIVLGNCRVKGNLGSNKRKIYHTEGDRYYDTVKYEMCFETEAEARAKGFIKSTR